MAKSFRITNGKEYVIVTIDDSGAYIIKDMSGRKLFLSRMQAELMRFGMDSMMGGENDADIKVEEL